MAPLLRQAVFHGRYNQAPWATNENIWVTFPDGLVDGGACYILTSFTRDAAGREKRPLMSIQPTLSNVNTQARTFDLGSEGETAYYWFGGKVSADGNTLRLDTFAPKNSSLFVPTQLALRTVDEH